MPPMDNQSAEGGGLIDNGGRHLAKHSATGLKYNVVVICIMFRLELGRMNGSPLEASRAGDRGNRNASIFHHLELSASDKHLSINFEITVSE